MIFSNFEFIPFYYSKRIGNKYAVRVLPIVILMFLK
ncbi:hypothetical protein T4C_383 [Trichinella pseudospiralis]|uniref:Uncharacterized protein n=1 Tax=Trichinella pseudospiralis TaxID=6337 RepID=A0A0V1G7K4_TRIPS|nr:hypothetical protein T4C_383 [Trichinella pseudospiralis]